MIQILSGKIQANSKVYAEHGEIIMFFLRYKIRKGYYSSDEGRIDYC